jgi:hypothetical protein
MDTEELRRKLSGKRDDCELVVRAIAREPRLIGEVMRILGTGGRVGERLLRLRCAKVVMMLSADIPGALYPHYDDVAAMLDCDNNIVKWNGIIAISNMASVDVEGRFDGVFEKYLSMLADKSMVSAANVAARAGAIALAKPHLSGNITRELLIIPRIVRGAECRLIIMGKALDSFDVYYDRIEEKGEVLAFARSLVKARRPAVRRKAVAFLKKHGK